MLREWEKLPDHMRTEAVRPYYNILKKKKLSLLLKRGFDLIAATIMVAVFLPVLAVVSILIVTDSKGGVFYRQERVTQYGKKFKILKFRTMVRDADKIGTQITVQNDGRVTRIGSILRKYRLDEIPQLINVIRGEMSFVGTRPETSKYVNAYTDEMRATLLLPAGITSEASICYKNEAEIFDVSVDNIDRIYIEKVLPQKMKYNLESLKKFSFMREIGIMIRTAFAVMKTEE